MKSILIFESYDSNLTILDTKDVDDALYIAKYFHTWDILKFRADNISDSNIIVHGDEFSLFDLLEIEAYNYWDDSDFERFKSDEEFSLNKLKKCIRNLHKGDYFYWNGENLMEDFKITFIKF